MFMYDDVWAYVHCVKMLNYLLLLQQNQKKERVFQLLMFDTNLKRSFLFSYADIL